MKDEENKAVNINSNYDLGDPNNYLIGLFLPIFRFVLYFKQKKSKKYSAEQILTGFLIYILYYLSLISLYLRSTIMFIIYLTLLTYILAKEYKKNNNLSKTIISKLKTNDSKEIIKINNEINNIKKDSFISILSGILILSGIYFAILPIVVYCFTYIKYTIGGIICILTAFLAPVGIELLEKVKEIQINFNSINIWVSLIFIFSGIILLSFRTFKKK